MKKNIIYTLMIFSLILVFNINILAEESEKESDNPAIDLNKVSYSIGYDIGKSLKKQDISINSENFIKGFKDGLSGISSDMTDTDMKNALMSFQKQMMEKQQMKFQEVSETNKAKGEKYRTEFKNQ
ncbi:FKBP-type peptidyl-prolyl cis-trans isomerase N-terminal domain-containing protein, partial [Candidatus Dependentiae bacterium]|nr:FKBP-type peptidyl-prolyl cis-trans isomerase N-terminal domain-containing protein [Candidatus Dependentiae bacterium]